MLDVLSHKKPSHVRINDINPDLCNLYITIRDYSNELIKQLSDMEKEFKSIPETDRKEYYLNKRARYNKITPVLNKNTAENIEDAALFIFLNHTCFNGLYRVNSKGAFNVPYGSYKNPKILDKPNIMEIHNALYNVEITCGDYKKCLDFIDSSTFVYLDPPYRPLSASSSFASYSSSEFGDAQQKELKSFVDNIADKEALFLLSNSDPKNTDPSDNFFDDLYSSYKIERVLARRSINSNGEKRQAITELIISNNFAT